MYYELIYLVWFCNIIILNCDVKYEYGKTYVNLFCFNWNKVNKCEIWKLWKELILVK